RRSPASSARQACSARLPCRKARATSRASRMNALAPNSSTDRQLAGARRLLAHLGEILQAELAVRLWNGERVALGPAAADAPVIAIRTPRAITRLLRRPALTTLIELAAAGDIDLESATLLDIAAKRGTMRTKGLLRRVDKKLAF